VTRPVTAPVTRPQPARRPTVEAALLVAGTLLAVGGVVLAHRAVAAPGVARGWPLHWLIVGWAVLAALAATCFRLATPRRAAVGIVLVLGVATRLAALAPVAPLSDDLYRYAWDGRVQAAGIDPYRYVPYDPAPAIVALKDDYLFPSPAGCAALGRPDPCTRLNRPLVPTIYPPVAEAWFLGLHVAGISDRRDQGLEGAGLVVDLGVLAALLALLRRTGRDPRWVAFWALSPLPVLEAVADAHVDGLAVLLTLGAVALGLRSRAMAAAGVLAAAALVKVFPVLLLPALLRGSWRQRAAGGALVAGLVAVSYLPHVLAVGTRVVGYLPGYLREEHYGEGTRYLLLGLLGLRGVAASAVALAVLAAVVAVVLARRPDPVLGSLWLYGALLLLTTPVQPWYALGLGALGVVAGRPEWLAVGMAGYAPYVAAVVDGDIVRAGRISYAAAVLIVAAAALTRHAAARRQTPARRRRTTPPVRSPAPREPAATTR